MLLVLPLLWAPPAASADDATSEDRAVILAALPRFAACGAVAAIGLELAVPPEGGVAEVRDADGAAKPADVCVAEVAASLALPRGPGRTVRIRLELGPGTARVTDLSQRPGYRVSTLSDEVPAPQVGIPGRTFDDLRAALEPHRAALGACVTSRLPTCVLTRVAVDPDGTVTGELVTALNCDARLAVPGLPASVPDGRAVQACVSAELARVRMAPVEGNTVRFTF